MYHKVHRSTLLRSSILLLITTSTLSLPTVLQAKTRAVHDVNTAQHSVGQLNTAQALRDFESLLTPFYQARAGRTLFTLPASAYLPTQADNFRIARNWDRLAPSFRKLYLQATAIPPGMHSFITPGKHFEIYYSSTGANAVSAFDTAGYDTLNWRVRCQGGNDVPDYIDEVGFAFDSAWSMEVNRFGFVKPYPFKDAAHPSERFKVVADSLPPYYYGITDVIGKVNNSSTGFSSIITIRHAWGPDWNIPNQMDYHTHPYKAIRITAAHEFFHALQYAMTWNVTDQRFLDDFTIGWTEGCAVLMEETGFDSINDYVQYAQTYFTDPDSTMFSNHSDGISEYKNSLLTIFLYHRAAGVPDIGFFESIYERNLTSPSSFLPLLQASSKNYMQSWSGLLGVFHAESYFSGTRSKPNTFIPDAALMPQWTYLPDPVGASTFTKKVSPLGMQRFSFRRRNDQGDTLKIQFAGRHGISDPATDYNWAVSLLLKKRGATVFDSLIHLPLHQSLLDTLSITTWTSLDEVLAIVTNSHDQENGLARISFDTVFVEPYYAAGTIAIYPNPYSLSHSKTLKIRGSNLVEARIYRPDGMLVSQGAYKQGRSTNAWEINTATGIDWHATNSTGKNLQPGTYFINIDQLQPGTIVRKTHRYKLLIKP